MRFTLHVTHMENKHIHTFMFIKYVYLRVSHETCMMITMYYSSML